MPGKCKFLNKWLEQPQYHAWLRNSPDIYKAHCKCCNKSFDISSMGESALQSHMKGIFISLFLPCVPSPTKPLTLDIHHFPDWVQAFSLEER
jgi:hypothetical protein